MLTRDSFLNNSPYRKIKNKVYRNELLTTEKTQSYSRRYGFTRIDSWRALLIHSAHETSSPFLAYSEAANLASVLHMSCGQSYAVILQNSHRQLVSLPPPLSL